LNKFKETLTFGMKSPVFWSTHLIETTCARNEEMPMNRMKKNDSLESILIMRCEKRKISHLYFIIPTEFVVDTSSFHIIHVSFNFI